MSHDPDETEETTDAAETTEGAAVGLAPDAGEGTGRRKRAERKDRLIQTRVPEGLESALKEEAHRRRLTVSHLIRNMIEDTFHLVDGVVEEVDNLVGDSMNLAFTVGEDAQKIAQAAKRGAERFRQRKDAGARGEAPGTPEGDTPTAAPEEGATETGGEVDETAEARVPAEVEVEAAVAPASSPRRSLDHVLAWNRVLLNRPATCARCATALAKGTEGYLGLSQDPTEPPAWLCPACAETLSEQ